MVLREHPEVMEPFDIHNLFIFDFSVIANIHSQEELDFLTNFILQCGAKVAISREFYENYEVIIKSVNDEQKDIAKKTYAFLNTLKQNSKLLYMSDIVDSQNIVKKLHKNDKVCFVFYRVSEFAENILLFADALNAHVIVADDKGVLHFVEDRQALNEILNTVIDECALDDDYFLVNYEVAPGKQVKLRDGSVYTLDTLIGNGGEGNVYNCLEQPEYVFKIYHPGQLNKLRLKKIFLMEQKQVRYNGICWPEKVIFSPDGKPLGYMMRKVVGNPLSKIMQSDEELLQAFPDWDKQHLIDLAIRILQKIQYLHLFGIIIGDLRLKNIVIDENGEPSLVDIDSCQIGSLPCPIGYPDFTPPELQHVEFKKQLRTYDNESFSCAVLIFKILFCGLHPYDQRNGADTIEEEISSKSFPYPENIKGDFSKIPWGGYDEMWRHMPFQIQSLFYDIFKNGNRYNVQELILMLKTYYEFINIKKGRIPSLNVISFFND